MPKDSNSKTQYKTKELEKKLKTQSRLAWDRLAKPQRDEVYRFAEGYKDFLDRAKTEREAVQVILGASRKEGFQTLGSQAKGEKLCGVNKEKSVSLAILGKAEK